MKINMKFILMKCHYFLFFAGAAPLLPILPVYALQLGIPPGGIGLIYTVLPFIGFIAKMLMGILADHLQKHKITFIVSILMYAIGYFCLYFCQPLPQKVSTEMVPVFLECDTTTVYITQCGKKCGSEDFFDKITTNRTTVCMLECLANIRTINDLCESWDIPPPCSGRSQDINITTTSELLALERKDECLALPVSSAVWHNVQMTNPSCLNDTSASCKMFCQAEPELMTYMGAKPLFLEIKEMLQCYQFWLYLFCLIVAQWGLSVSVTMSDTICFQQLGPNGHGNYGQQRLFGSLGWGTLAVATGALIDYASEGHSEKDYTPAFVLALTFLLLDVFVATRFTVEVREKRSLASCGSVLRLFSEPKITLFVLCCIVMGISTGMLWTFQFMFVEQVALEWDCHFPYLKLLVGLMMGIQCFGGELPFFFLSGSFLQWLGHVYAISVSILVFGLRFVLYSSISNPWLFLPTELLNGFTYGIFYAAMTSYASVVAPRGTEATLQGLFGASFEGIGIAIGGLVGGSLYFVLGASQMFLNAGICNIVFAFVHIALQVALAKCCPSQDARSSIVSYSVPDEVLQCPVEGELVGDSHGDNTESDQLDPTV